MPVRAPRLVWFAAGEPDLVRSSIGITVGYIAWRLVLTTPTFFFHRKLRIPHMSLPSSTCTLIVGAGPSGLAAALSLIHHGFRDFVIVDAVTQGENGSRAIFLHAATMEVSTPP